MKRTTSTQAGSVSLNTTGLQALVEDVKKFSRVTADVGVFNPRNAEIGFAHEFGVITRGLPERSFLRMPITAKLPGEIAKQSTDAWKKLLQTKGLRGVMQVLGLMSEKSVQDAFDTGGFGQWPALKPSTVRNKGSTAILIDTAQLRQAVTSRVV